MNMLSQVKYAIWKHLCSHNIGMSHQAEKLDAGQQELLAVVQMRQDGTRIVAVEIRKRGWIL